MIDQVKNGWHIDKTIQVSFLLGLMFQTGVFIWWASAQNSKLEDHERRITAEERSTEQTRDRSIAQEARLVRIEGGIQTLLDTARRLEQRIDSRSP